MNKTKFKKQIKKFSGDLIYDTQEIIVRSLNTHSNLPFLFYGIDKGYISVEFCSDNYFEVRWTNKGLKEIQQQSIK